MRNLHLTEMGIAECAGVLYKYTSKVGIIIFILYIFILSIECLQLESFGTDISTFSMHNYPGG